MNYFRLKPHYVAAIKALRYSLTVDTQHGPADYVDTDNNVIMFDCIGHARNHITATQERGGYACLF